MTRRVIFNKKGGVGKTTITCNLAAISAEKGLNTLVIDLDPQANASHYLLNGGLAEAESRKKTIYDYYEASLDTGSAFGFNPFFAAADKPDRNIRQYLHQTPFENLWIVPSHPDLADIENRLVTKHKIYKLRDMLDALPEFDAVYIDTPPAMNFFSQSALIAASGCLIPFDCDTFSKDAIHDVGKHIGDIQNDHNQGLRVEGIIVNQFMPRANHPRKIVEDLINEGLPVLSAHLSASVKIRESHQSATPMVFLDPRHKLTVEFIALYDEIIRQEKNG